jgi:hypothetical protein
MVICMKKKSEQFLQKIFEGQDVFIAIVDKKLCESRK